MIQYRVLAFLYFVAKLQIIRRCYVLQTKSQRYASHTKLTLTKYWRVFGKQKTTGSERLSHVVFVKQ